MDSTEANDVDKVALVSNRAVSSINTFINEFPDVTVFDLMEYMKFFNVYGAKIIAGNSLKNGEHPNVRTVINDVSTASIEMMEALIPTNPELADDFVWPKPDAEQSE